MTRFMMMTIIGMSLMLGACAPSAPHADRDGGYRDLGGYKHYNRGL